MGLRFLLRQSGEVPPYGSMSHVVLKGVPWLGSRLLARSFE